MVNAGIFQKFLSVFLLVMLIREQDKLPAGATLLGTVLSSDKTNISAMTGNRSAHPLLISLANIFMNFQNKSSNHLFLLLALLPIPHYTHPTKKIRGVLNNRLFHQCLDIVLAPLKKAAEIGVMMADPLGYLRFCFTPLAAYIVDTPESALISGVAGKTSSVTMASYKQFGDNFRHEPRTASTTLAQLQAAESTTNPWDLPRYVEEAMKFWLNGVHQPFWRDYPLSDPSVFLTSEPLHHWHKQFWDHDTKWCINGVGCAEIDFRFSVLHQHTGYRHFKEGISSLKQVTGREHRDVQRYIVPMSADVLPPKFMIAIRSLLDFRYFAQSPFIDSNTCAKISQSLLKFHDNKQAILDSGARRGKGKSKIAHWHIPKLEFMQSVASNIQQNGVAIQWSADVTEHAHIEVVKDPAAAGNNQNYEAQICRYLDRSDKIRQFDLATALCEANIDFRGTDADGGDDESDWDSDDEDSHKIRHVSATSDLLENIRSLSGTRYPVNYFEIASKLKSGEIHNAPFPYRTHQSSPQVAFHLTQDPNHKRLLIAEVAMKYDLPDLWAALGDYLHRMDSEPAVHKKAFIRTIGGRRVSPDNCLLPFTHLEVWERVRIQSKGYFFPHEILPPQTINAFPPTSANSLGNNDAVIVNLDADQEWPTSGINGE